jgi:hypothetical protein
MPFCITYILINPTKIVNPSSSSEQKTYLALYHIAPVPERDQSPSGVIPGVKSTIFVSPEKVRPTRFQISLWIFGRP